MPSLCIYVTKAIMVTSQLFVSPLLKLASYAVRFRLCLPAAPNANVCCFTGSWLPGLRVGHDKRLSMPAECLASSRSSKINCYTNEYVENWKGQFSFIN